MRKYLAFCIFLATVIFAEPLKELRRELLFDFTKGTPGTVVPGWNYVEWDKGKVNGADFVYSDGKADIHFRAMDIETREYSAPNRYMDFPAPQDWTDFNFLELDIINPATESNLLRIDLDSVGTERNAVATPMIPVGETRFLVPLSVFAKFRVPCNLKQVTRFNLLRTSLSRPIDFSLRSISLLKIQPRTREYSFPELSAWQFGKSDQPLQEGLTLITPESPVWKDGKVTALDINDKRLAKYGPLALSGITGTQETVLELPVKNDGLHRVMLLIHGKPSLINDTTVIFDDAQMRHIVVGNSYPEIMFTDVQATDGVVRLTLKRGPQGPWLLTAAVVFPTSKATEYMRDFVWPLVEDITIASWAERSMSTEITENDTRPLLQHDLYRQEATAVKSLSARGRQLIFSLCPQNDCGNAAITIKDCIGPDGKGLSLTAALNYTYNKGTTYLSVPRHFRTFDKALSLRGGHRQWFALEAVGAPGKYKGHIEVKNVEGVSIIPFEFDVQELKTDPNYNSFLYYYPTPWGPVRERYLACMKNAGFNSVEVPVLIGKRFTREDGTIGFDLKPMEDYMKLYMKQGFKGDVIPLYLYNPFTTMNKQLFGTPYATEPKDIEKSIDHLVKHVKDIEALSAKHPEWPRFAYYPFDEYRVPDYIARFHKAIRDLGAEVFTTSVGKYGRGMKLSPDDHITIACFPGSFDADAWDNVRQQAKELNIRLYSYTMSSQSPLMQRFVWGLRAWEMGMSGFGAWHFFSGGLCVSEFLHGAYTYNYAAFGPGNIMHTPALFGASQGLMDYAALKRAESTPEAAAIVAEIRQEARKLRTATEPQVLSWYREKGETLLEKVRETVGF